MSNRVTVDGLADGAYTCERRVGVIPVMNKKKITTADNPCNNKKEKGDKIGVKGKGRYFIFFLHSSDYYR